MSSTTKPSGWEYERSKLRAKAESLLDSNHEILTRLEADAWTLYNHPDPKIKAIGANWILILEEAALQ